MKKEKSNFVVYLVMLLLLSFIVVPPLFRKLMPKQIVPSTETTIDDIAILNCNKTDSDGVLTASMSIRYRNGVLENNIVKFTKNDAGTIQENQTIEQENSTITVLNEYNNFMSFEFLNPVTAENITTVTLTTDLASQDATNFLSNYLQNIDEQKLYCESIGYTCNILRS